MNIFKHESTMKSYIFLMFISLATSIHFIFEKEFMSFVVSFMMGWLLNMFVYFGLEWAFEDKKEVLK